MHIDDTPVLRELQAAEEAETYLDARILELKERLDALQDEHSDVLARLRELRARRTKELCNYRNSK